MSNVSYMGWLRTKVGSVWVLSPSVGAVIHDHEGRLLLQEKSSGEAGASLPTVLNLEKARKKQLSER